MYGNGLATPTDTGPMILVTMGSGTSVVGREVCTDSRFVVEVPVRYP